MANNTNIIEEFGRFQVSKAYICSPEQCKTYLSNPQEYNKIFHINIRSLNHNFTYLLTLLQRITINFDIIILTECWLSKCPQLPVLSGYVSFKSDYFNQNAGVVVYVRENIPCSHEVLKVDQSSCILLKLPNNVAVIAIYRSPSEKNADSFLVSLDNTLKLVKTYENVSIIGDININIAEDNIDTNSDNYLNLLALHGLLPAHTFPTHNQNCIDHVILKTKNISVTLVLDSLITDHSPTILFCKQKPLSHKALRVSNRTNVKACSEQLKSLDYSPILTCRDPERATDLFLGLISDVVKAHTVSKIIPSRERIIKPWITPGLLRCLRHRDKLYRETKKFANNSNIILTYTRYKNFCNNLIKKLKRQYECEQFEKAKKNPKATWDLIKNLSNLTKQTTSANELLTSSNRSDALDSVNHYFANVGNELASKIDKSYLDPTYKLPCADPPLNSMSLLYTDCAEIESLINGLKSTCANGWDGISATLIKSAKQTLIPVLEHIFNLCLSSGIFPLAFKKALVHPIYKSGDRGSVTNYRPISVLTTTSKLLEKIINARLVNYLCEKQIIACNQFGFTKGKSTEDAVLSLTEIVAENLNNKNKTLGIFLDLSKAFDTVSVPYLIKKLERVGIRGVALEIFKSYLSDRSQCVVIDGITSKYENLTFGVPQGSVLGPTLFLIYLNDLCKLSLPCCKIITYADDTALLIHGKDWTDARGNAEYALSVVMNWLGTNLLTLNLEKTFFIPFAPIKSSLPDLDFKIQAHNRQCPRPRNCDCMTLKRASNIKYLGVWLDDTLSWEEHIKVTSNRTRKLIFVFKTLRNVVDGPTLKTIYLALGQSILSYCVTVWGGTSQTNLLRLERAQRAVLKVMTHKPIYFPTYELYANTGFLTVRQLFILQVLLRKHAKLPYDPDLITRKRRSDLVCKNKYSRLVLAKRIFCYLSPRLYNKVNKKLNIYPLTLIECKKRVTIWLQKLSYTETESLIS